MIGDGVILKWLSGIGGVFWVALIPREIYNIDCIGSASFIIQLLRYFPAERRVLLLCRFKTSCSIGIDDYNVLQSHSFNTGARGHNTRCTVASRDTEALGDLD